MAPTAIHMQSLRGNQTAVPLKQPTMVSRAWLRQGCRAIAGLGREAISNPGRLRSDRAGSFDSARTSHARWLRASLALTPCRASQPSPCPSKRRGGGWSYLSTRPTSSHPEASRGGGERCVSPTSATDVQHEHPHRCWSPAAPASFPSTLRREGGLPRAGWAQRLWGSRPAAASNHGWHFA